MSLKAELTFKEVMMRLKIIEILAEGGVAKSKIEALAEAIAAAIPQNTRGSHQPYEENGVQYVWCSRHGKYHPIDMMVPNRSKEIGVANYCRAAQRKWEWMHAKSGLILSIAAQAFVSGDNVKAKKLVDLGNYLKDTKNVVSTFDNIDVEMTSDQVIKLCEEEFFAEFPELKSKPKKQ